MRNDFLVFEDSLPSAGDSRLSTGQSRQVLYGMYVLAFACRTPSVVSIRWALRCAQHPQFADDIEASEI